MKRSIGLWVLVCGLWSGGCDDASSADGADGAVGDGDGTEAELTWPGAEWELAEPVDVGLDAEVLEGAREYAFDTGKETQGVVVVRHGRVAAEWYARGSDADTLGTSWSAAKSFTSTLIGIALDRGELPGLDAPMADYVTQWQGSDREVITIEHVLRMQSGLAWSEGMDNIALQLSNDQETIAFDREVASPPMGGFNYSSADTQTLGTVIDSLGEGNAGAYADEHLLGPIGMTAHWWQDTLGVTATYCCIDATAREMARFGLLFARGGNWDGTQVVSEEWVERATAPADNNTGYGLQWWLGESDNLPPHFMSRGKDSNLVYVVPELDLVVVRQSTYMNFNGEDYILDGSLHILTNPSEGGWDDDAFLGPIVDAVIGD